MFTNKYKPNYHVLKISLKVMFRQKMTHNQGWHNVFMHSKLVKEKCKCAWMLIDFSPLNICMTSHTDKYYGTFMEMIIQIREFDKEIPLIFDTQLF